MRKRLARVLGSDGRPRPSFQWADPERQEPVRDVLSAEDVRFLDSGSKQIHRRESPRPFSRALVSPK